MKEKKMHMGPWRKQKYMQPKWLGLCKRTTSIPLLAVGDSARLRSKPKHCHFQQHLNQCGYHLHVLPMPHRRGKCNKDMWFHFHIFRALLEPKLHSVSPCKAG
ncbi:hypothetical protein PS1_038313 [Malus domestica]